MTKIKEPSVAGSFYSDNKSVLENQITSFKSHSVNFYKNSARAVIVPHAGLIYSGRLAYEGISQLDKSIKNIFILAPAHRIAFEGLALSGYDEWKTPLGNIKINQDINNELISEFGAKIIDEAIAPEHSIEIEVPIIQSVFEDVNIIPILIGKEYPQKISDIISKYYDSCGFVISSDLSHFLTDEKAKRIDDLTAQLIETNTTDNFSHELACGATGILGLIGFAREKNYSLIRIDMANSGDVTSDKNRVVGYGCWFLYEGERNNFIKEYYSDFVLDICKKSIESKFKQKPITVQLPQVFLQMGASFVTLEKQGRLRGCIGSIVPHRRLIEDLMYNAKNSAFSDPRFRPVEENEIEELDIAISLLSMPKPMSFKNEDDLLNQIRQNIDGIIIKDKGHQAVYLPSVWEQLPDKTDFLNSLKMKAGLPANHFSDTFEAFRFETVYIKNNN